MLMETLNNYERVSRQKINKSKSRVSLFSKEHDQARQRVEEITGMSYKSLPIKYMGFPLYEGRRHYVMFSEMMSKILYRTGGWKNKLPSIG